MFLALGGEIDQVHRLAGLLGDAQRHGGRDVFEIGAEFLAAEAAERIGLADIGPHGVGDAHQGKVAGLMAVAVVDHLEMVDIDDEQRRLALTIVIFIGVKVVLDPLDEGAAVERTGQGIVGCKDAQLFIGEMDPAAAAP